MSGKTKILFLYPLVQPYLMAGIKSLVENYDADVLLYRWKTSKEAPLSLTELKNVRIEEKGDVKAMSDDVINFKPDIVYISGWMDRDYWRLAKTLFKRSTIVMGMDNQWLGNFKQFINSWLDPKGIHKRIHYAWVPGYTQYEYAARLGFKSSGILTGSLTPDTKHYESAFLKSRMSKAEKFPHSFLYVGRLVEHKCGNLLRAFSSFAPGELKDWHLMVVGAGDLATDPIVQHERIKYNGFAQPETLPGFAEVNGVFCLVNPHEPYGTVVPEFAAAGMPLMVTQSCSAASTHLINGYNGFLVRDASVETIRKTILKVIGTNDAELHEMGNRSHSLASGRNSNTWAATLMSVLN